MSYRVTKAGGNASTAARTFRTFEHLEVYNREVDGGDSEFMPDGDDLLPL